VMVRDDMGGELRTDGRYHKELTSEDLRKLEKGEQLARQIIEHAGGKHIFKSTLSAAHLGGAIRINEHVDENLQTEFKNLHVCDGSIIPETTKVAPALTLICLGKYLAGRLAQAH
jgi:choline dehydrogenase-like flavoprotein